MVEPKKPAPGGSRIRKLILDKVRLLGPTEHQEIFSLLQAHGIAYSSNSNGVFINLSTVPDDVLATVKAFVDYCAVNKTGLDEYEKRLQECKITHKFDIITTLAESGGSNENKDILSPDTEVVLPEVTDVVPLSSAPASSTPHAAPVVQFQTMAPRGSHTLSSVNSLPSVLINGRFQATKKRFSRRKIVDRKQVVSNSESVPAVPLAPTDMAVLCPEDYTYVHTVRQAA